MPGWKSISKPMLTFIAAMDANGDGRLGADEFVDYCMRGKTCAKPAQEVR